MWIAPSHPSPPCQALVVPQPHATALAIVPRGQAKGPPGDRGYTFIAGTAPMPAGGNKMIVHHRYHYHYQQLISLRLVTFGQWSSNICAAIMCCTGDSVGRLLKFDMTGRPIGLLNLIPRDAESTSTTSSSRVVDVSLSGNILSAAVGSKIFTVLHGPMRQLKVPCRASEPIVNVRLLQC